MSQTDRQTDDMQSQYRALNYSASRGKNYTPWLKKQSKLFSSELRQICTNFDNFWHKDGQEAQDDELLWGTLIFHLI